MKPNNSVIIAGRRVLIGMSIVFRMPGNTLAIGQITRIDKSAHKVIVNYNGKDRAVSFENAEAAKAELRHRSAQNEGRNLGETK